MRLRGEVAFKRGFPSWIFSKERDKTQSRKPGFKARELNEDNSLSYQQTLGCLGPLTRSSDQMQKSKEKPEGKL